MSYITYNLTPDNAMSVLINLFFTINTFTSYPVQILCCFEILETYKFFNNEEDSQMVKNLKIAAERVFIVICITLLASVIPNFVAFLNFVGGLGCCILGFILPPLYYLQYFTISRLTRHEVVFNIFIIVFGVVGGGYSVYMSLVDLIEGNTGNL